MIRLKKFSQYFQHSQVGTTSLTSQVTGWQNQVCNMLWHLFGLWMRSSTTMPSAFLRGTIDWSWTSFQALRSNKLVKASFSITGVLTAFKKLYTLAALAIPDSQYQSVSLVSGLGWITVLNVHLHLGHGVNQTQHRAYTQPRQWQLVVTVVRCCMETYGNHTSHHEVVFLRWFRWYRYIHDTCCHSSHLEVFVCVRPSTATLVNPNIYRMAQTAKQCEPKLQVTALNYLSFKRSLGWHFAQSLVSRVGAETPGHLQVTSSFHTTADAAAQAGSVALLILVKHQHDSSNLIIYIVSQRHRIVSFAGHMSTSVSYVPILRESIFRQARLLCWSNPFPCNNSWIPEDNVTFARMANVSPARPKMPKCPPALLKDLWPSLTSTCFT